MLRKQYLFQTVLKLYQSLIQWKMGEQKHKKWTPVEMNLKSYLRMIKFRMDVRKTKWNYWWLYINNIAFEGDDNIFTLLYSTMDWVLLQIYFKLSNSMKIIDQRMHRLNFYFVFRYVCKRVERNLERKIYEQCK